jgi:sulfate adenylyltransferase large subunit
MSGPAANGSTTDPFLERSVELLRFATAGSVDDGKSTLIGRLLYDTKSILQDQLDQVAEASQRRHGDGTIDLSLLTDGLRAEREQGITIDVAYRYFATPRRTFILADTPGHVQYTRNMVTGASTADLAIVLVDARNGVVEQTKRHAFIASLLGIPHIVVAVNKMDLVGWSEDRFDEIVREFSDFSRGLAAQDVTFIPLSALHGDNVVDVGGDPAGAWYRGPSLLEHLETVEAGADRNLDDLRFPVQWVIRPGDAADHDLHDFRGYAGQVASGVVRPGDRVVVLPSGRETTVASVETADGPLEEAYPPLSVTLRLTDDVDVSRGDLISHVEDRPSLEREFTADVCWMGERPLTARTRLLLKHATSTSEVVIDDHVDLVDVHALQRVPAPALLALNDIGSVRIRARRPLAFDAYARNRATGRFVLIDEATNDTVAAGMIR